MPTPAAFPSDFPVYQQNCLAEASLTSDFPLPGQSAWGMVWETLDGVDEVVAFYPGALDAAGWKITISHGDAQSYVAFFKSKSKPNAGGMLMIFAAPPVTKISVAFAPN